MSDELRDFIICDGLEFLVILRLVVELFGELVVELFGELVNDCDCLDVGGVFKGVLLISGSGTGGFLEEVSFLLFCHHITQNTAMRHIKHNTAPITAPTTVPLILSSSET